MLLLSRFAKIFFLSGLALVLLACGDNTVITVPVITTAPSATSVIATASTPTTVVPTTVAATTTAATTQAATAVPTTVRATNTPMPDDQAVKARKAVEAEAQRSQNI